MTRRQTLAAALSPFFAPLLAVLPGRAERKAVEPVSQWTGFVGGTADSFSTKPVGVIRWRAVKLTPGLIAAFSDDEGHIMDSARYFGAEDHA